MTLVVLRGVDLRYALTRLLGFYGSATVPELIDRMHSWGFTVEGRPSKVVSDALRWEIRHGRVRRHDRGEYGPSYIPRSTEHRIIRRVQALVPPLED